ncbi:MAG: hypothetical protein DWQ31_06870 [Planctomycetota bacterium]|nr:MAG: hypothetical protein DWQ31_06870 [Planctomycetota bacterium]REJ92272.1 MAG: hypothetical protein DWQ35_12570 [Planctomycetota bacterium]REK18565.1 MAG: hypothetical protein DWQ42_19290 [Planctomycetota bacterium]REK49216.1 MAG: hypothetical protein DWQ46_00800 [Planctomycetota bacterium]
MTSPDAITRRTFNKATATTAVLSAAALSSRLAAADDHEKPLLRAGAAEVAADIPAEGTFLIGPMAKSTGQNDPLYIRALVLDDGKQKLALVTNDLLGFDFAYHDVLVDAIHQRTGIPQPQIMINSSHNHSAPLTIPWSTSWEAKKDKPWHKTLPGQFADVVEEAAEHLTPARLQVSREATQIGVNRRIEAVHGMTMAPNPHGDHVPWTDGLYLTGKEDGWPIGILFSYAAHPVIVHGASKKISADYPGFACNILRAAMRRDDAAGRRPGVAMFAQGCGGDINGAPLASGIDAARGAGRDLGYAVQRGLRREKKYVDGSLRVVNRELRLPLQAPPSVEACEARLAKAPNSGPNQELLAIARAGEPRFLRFPMQAFAVGDELCILGMPHELFAGYQLYANEVSPFKHTFVFAYTNGCEHYIARAADYEMGDRGGYEASPFGAAFIYFHRLACRAEVEGQIKEGMVKILQELKGA